MTIRFDNHFVAIRNFKLTIYSDFVNTNITVKNTSINLDVMSTTAFKHSLFDWFYGLKIHSPADGMLFGFLGLP